MKWCDTVKAAIMHGPLPPDVTLDVPHWRQPGMPLLCATDFLAPAPLKRKRVESKTNPASIHGGVPDEAKLWFVDFHAYHARVHGKTYSATSCGCASSTCAIASESHRIAYGTWTRQLYAWFPAGVCGWTKRAESTPVFPSRAFRHGHTCCKHERRHVDTECLRGEDRPSAPSWTTLSAPARVPLSDALDTQEALLDMIDAIDTDMNVRW